MTGIQDKGNLIHVERTAKSIALDVIIRLRYYDDDDDDDNDDDGDSQEEYEEDDPANPCTNYPTEEFSSYAACDEHFVRRSLPPGLKPFWAVDNISQATRSFSIKTEEYSDDMIGR